MMIFRWLLFSLSALLMTNLLWAAPVNITDDLGQKIRLSKPARRIIVLTPHLAEILVGLGAEEVIVGFVKTPGRPISLPKAQLVGAEGHLNREKILVLKPDLIIAWGAMSAWQKEQLKKTGVPVFISDPKKVADIGKTILQLGILTGKTDRAAIMAEQFKHRLSLIYGRYKNKEKARVFLQVWMQPVITIGEKSILNDAIGLCGGQNIFASQSQASFPVAIESVIAQNPDVMIGLMPWQQKQAFLSQWRVWSTVSAVKGGHLYPMDIDSLSRPSHLFLEGVETLCQWIDRSRKT